MNKNTKVNPAAMLFLSACPALAATADVRTGLLMGASILAVMLLAGLVVSLLKNVLTSRVSRLFVCMLFALCAQMLLRALDPSLINPVAAAFGALAVSFCAFGAAEKAAEAAPGEAVKYALCGGVSVIVLMFVISVIREVLGKGSFAGMEIAFLGKYTVPMLAAAPGAFLAAGIVLAIAQKVCGNADTAEAVAASLISKEGE